MNTAHLKVPKKPNPNHPARRPLTPVAGLPVEPYSPGPGRADLRIGQRVLVLREAAGITQTELGRRCSPPMCGAAISRIERRGVARDELVGRLAQALGVTRERLLQDAPLQDLARQILAHPRPSEGAEVALWDAAQAVASRASAGGQAGEVVGEVEVQP